MATHATLTAQQTDLLNSLAARLLPGILSCHANLDAVHRHAVELMTRGQAAEAQRLFRLVREQAQAFPGLAAWAWYKEGEIFLEQGQQKQAQACFKRALELSPGHLKARLGLHPAHEPLRIVHGPQHGWHPVGFSLDFGCNNLALWEYYLSARPADEIWIAPPLKMLDFDLRTVRAVHERYLAPRGVVVLGLAADRQTRITHAELGELARGGETPFRDAVRQCLEALLA